MNVAFYHIQETDVSVRLIRSSKEDELGLSTTRMRTTRMRRRTRWTRGWMKGRGGLAGEILDLYTFRYLGNIRFF